MLRLVLVFAWGVMAVYLCFDLASAKKINNTKVMFLVIAVLMGLFNLVRWWSYRQRQQQNRPTEGDWRRPPTRRASDDREVNPDFVFDEPAPRPPSTNGTTEESQ